MKRSYAGSNTSRSKRRRLNVTKSSSTGRRNTYRRKRFRRRFKRFRGGNRRLTARYNFKGGIDGKAITKHIHIWNTVKSNLMQRQVYATIGRNHFIRKLYSGATSALAGQNRPYLILCGPYANTTGHASSFEWDSIANFGLNNYQYDFPYNVEKFLFSYMKIRLVFRQVNENARIRICVARKVKSGTTYSMTSLWDDGWDHSVDNPLSTMWNVYYQKNLTFDQPVIAGNGVGTTNRARKELNLYLPFHRVVSSPTNAIVTSESSWTLGSYVNDFSYLIIDSDDLTFADTENVRIEAYVEWAFFTTW